MKRVVAVSAVSALLLTGLLALPANAIAPGNCTTGSLTIIANEVTSAFGCSGEAVVPATVTSIGASAFEDEADVHTITFAAGSALTSIGAQAFASSGITAIAIPSGVMSIGAQAFALTSDLTSIAFDAESELTVIGFEGFINSGLTAITIPASVSAIGDAAFELTADLTAVTFESGSQLTAISQEAFQYSGLTRVEIPTGVTSIGIGAFYNNLDLETVRIPSTVTSIAASAFQRTISLTDVYFAGKTAPAVGADAFGDPENMRVLDAKARISYSARSSFGLLGTTWNDLVVQYTKRSSELVEVLEEPQLVSLTLKGSSLSTKQMKKLRALVLAVGRKGSFEITAGVVKKEGMTRAGAKALARNQAKLVRGYLVARGVKLLRTSIKVRVLDTGAMPKTLVVGRKL